MNFKHEMNAQRRPDAGDWQKCAIVEIGFIKLKHLIEAYCSRAWGAFVYLVVDDDDDADAGGLAPISRDTMRAPIPISQM